jgi:hypothetical protein
MNFEAILFNKRKFRDIKLNGGGDLCLPTLNGKVLKVPTINFVKIPLFNYDTTFRTKSVIAHDRARFAKLGLKHF